MKILFVCTGNICRSPTAHAVFRHKIKTLGLDAYVESAGTHAYHVGHAPDKRSAEAAKARGYDMSDLRARQVQHEDFENFDLILCMDRGHLLTLQRVAPPQYQSRLQMFDTDDVGDPYYGSGDGFERVLDQIEMAADRWIRQISASKS